MTISSTRCLPLALLLSLLAATALAQGTRPTTPLAGEVPSEGITLPEPSLVSRSDAASVQLNPGSMALAPSWSLLLHHTEISRSARVGGGGDALFVASPLPFIKALSLGTGLQWVRPADAIGFADYVKWSIAVGARWRQVVSLGASFHIYFSNSDRDLDDLWSMDLGLTVRPWEWLGLGFVVRDLTTPFYGEYPLQRVYELELMGRPLGTRRLEIGAAVRIGERRGTADPRLIVTGEPIKGLRLFGNVDAMRRDFNRDDNPLWDVRATLGLELNLEHVGLAVSTIIGRAMPEAPSGPLSGSTARNVYQGLGISLRVDGARRDPLVTFSKRLVAVKLDSSLDELGMIRLVSLLRQVERRGDLHGVLLKIDGLSPGWAQAQELRGWLRRLRDRGKVSYAYLRSAQTREYYLAAGADHVMLDPAGGVQVKGMAMRSLFFRGLFDKLGLSAQFVRIAEYKSAPEAYTRSTASGPAREVRESLLDDLYGQLVADLARDRKRGESQMRQLVEQGPYTPPGAETAGLVDKQVDPGKLISYVEKHSQASVIPASRVRRQAERWQVGPELAVVLVEGDIVRGKSTTIPLIDRRMVGDQSVVAALQAARRSSTVKAVVLRINSPGGSAMASHRIWQEVATTRKSIPVVVSLGDIAASGGYYVAAGGAPIFAEPATITGSIGIFTGKFDLGGLMGKLGLTMDTHERGPRALMDSFHRPYSTQERKLILERLQYYYRLFLGAVSKGRKLTQDQVHEVARGRVWTGHQALGRKLVDHTGGLVDAMEKALELAGYAPDRPMRIKVLPKPRRSLLMRLLELTTSAESSDDTLQGLPLPGALRQALRGIPPVLLRHTSGHPLARLPYEILF